LIGLIKKKID
jgi:hypothetical protein